MKTKTVYEAVDGRTFNDAQPCRDHEERLFSAWLKANKDFETFLALDPDTRDERRAVIRDFWAWKGGK